VAATSASCWPGQRCG